MSLFTLLITQQQRTKNAQILARLGNWTNYMKPSRSISTNAFTGLEQRATREAVKCVKSSTPTRSSRDYRIYPQSVDLDAFFGEEHKCEKVSDVCLLNDHFILVKMPDEKPATPPPPPPPAAAAVHRKLGSKLPRCFKCNRGSRVSPIMETLEEPEPKDYVPWNPHDDDTDNDVDDDDDDVEVFASRTRIIPKQPQPKPISVILEQPQPQRTPPTPPPPLPCLQLESLQYPPPALANPFPVITRGPLHWFLWPFRRRTRTQQQQQQQLAAVHKTYFIRWNKPPDTLYHGYGVERTPQPEKVGLRRCRSAIF